MELKANSKIKKTDNFVASDIDGQAVMMSIENNKYFGMDEIGTSIWNLLEKSPRFEDLISALMNEYEIDIHTCEADTKEFLEHLIKYDLIEIK